MGFHPSQWLPNSSPSWTPSEAISPPKCTTSVLASFVFFFEQPHFLTEVSILDNNIAEVRF